MASNLILDGFPLFDSHKRAASYRVRKDNPRLKLTTIPALIPHDEVMTYAFRVTFPLWGKSTAHKGPVMRNFDALFDVRLNKRLNEQWSCRWFWDPMVLITVIQNTFPAYD